MLKNLFFLYLIIAITGCNIINPAEPVPTYIHVDSFVVKDRFGVPTLHNVNAVWVYNSNILVGTYDLPATIPVIMDKPSRISLAAGIPVSGMNNFIDIYPFYTRDTFTVTPSPGNIINHIGNTTYYPSINELIIANFDLGGSGFGLAEGTVPIGVTKADSEKYSGYYSGVIRLSAPRDTLSVDSSIEFMLPSNKDVYLEFDYRCTIPFYIGLRSNSYGFTNLQYVSGISPSTKWRKFYYSFRDFISKLPGDTYTLYINASLPPGTQNGKVLLDNIKMIYF